MHYIDSNTDLNNPVTLYLNTRVESSVLVDVELYSENENKLIYTGSGLSKPKSKLTPNQSQRQSQSQS